MLKKKGSDRKKVTALIADKLPKIVANLIRIITPIDPMPKSGGELNKQHKYSEIKI